MVDITFKSYSQRTAIASATVSLSKEDTLKAVQDNQVPKGNVLEIARAAGLLAVKKTSDLIPDCHPLPIEYTRISYTFNALDIIIRVEVQTIYKTGIEVEAMHGASVVALTLYDMLKPLDKGIMIRNIMLEEKKGGKSDQKKDIDATLQAAVIVCSDSVSQGKKQDTAGQNIITVLEKFEVQLHTYQVIPDEVEVIREHLHALLQTNINMIIFTGGTGLSPRDVTPEALLPLIERRLPGVEETIRTYGQQRMPYAMLSRSVAGLIGEKLVLALPGSSRGARESMEAIFPAILHVFKVLAGTRHPL